jgi:hypothetical protein
MYMRRSAGESMDEMSAFSSAAANTPGETSLWRDYREVIKPQLLNSRR